MILTNSFRRALGATANLLAVNLPATPLRPAAVLEILIGAIRKVVAKKQHCWTNQQWHPALRRALSAHGAPFIVASLCVHLAATPADAQLANLATATPAPTATEAVDTPSPNQRDAEYASLARDVQSLDREFGIVKRVVKLVTPAVVHIESKPLPKFQGLLHIEEAGSGVIVQFGSKSYVLTNRHVVRHSSPERIEIHLSDGRVFHPTKIWSDSETDVAALGDRCGWSGRRPIGR